MKQEFNTLRHDAAGQPLLAGDSVMYLDYVSTMSGSRNMSLRKGTVEYFTPAYVIICDDKTGQTMRKQDSFVVKYWGGEE